MTNDDIRQWVLDTVDEQTSVDDPITSKGQLKQRIRNYEHDVDDVIAAADELVAEDELFGWHGILAPTDDDILKAIIERERQFDLKRQLLIAKCNKLRKNHD